MNEENPTHWGLVCGRSPTKIVGFESHPGLVVCCVEVCVTSDRHVVRRGDRWSAYWDLSERGQLEDLGVDGRIFKKWNGQVAGRCELSGFHKCGEFVDWLRKC
jgi:hypothetical protein